MLNSLIGNLISEGSEGRKDLHVDIQGLYEKIEESIFEYGAPNGVFHHEGHIYFDNPPLYEHSDPDAFEEDPIAAINSSSLTIFDYSSLTLDTGTALRRTLREGGFILTIKDQDL